MHNANATTAQADCGGITDRQGKADRHRRIGRITARRQDIPPDQGRIGFFRHNATKEAANITRNAIFDIRGPGASLQNQSAGKYRRHSFWQSPFEPAAGTH
ncbi:MAG: hypothetical protein CMM62_01555 [Rhodospirillaceae bacterium]|nr:hypothetical protein [Rhodospirillaceae bacterium]